MHHLIRDLFAGVGGSVQDGSAWFDYGGVEFDLELSEDQVRMLEHVTGSSSRSPSGD